MKKIRYVLLILVVLLFSGCAGNYNLTFNKDLSVTEELNVTIEDNGDTYEKTYSIFEQANIEEDKYEIVIIDDKVRIKYKENYSSFSNYYLNSKLYKMLFENIEYKKDNRGIVINANDNLKLNDKNNQNIVNSYDITDLKINMIIPFSVNNSNADSVKENTYTWNLNSNDTYKEISVDFSYKQDNVYGIIMISIVGVAVLATLIYIIRYLLRNTRL